MLVRMAISIESKIVKTEMIQKMPIVIPDNDKIVRILLTIIAWNAKIKLSLMSLKISNIVRKISKKIMVKVIYFVFADMKAVILTSIFGNIA